MTPDQQQQFLQHGYLRLAGLLDKGLVLALKAQVLDELQRRKLWSGGRMQSKQLSGLPPFQQITKLSQWIQVPHLYQKLMTAPVVTAMEQLAGKKRGTTGDAQLLISLPHKQSWSLQGLNWHRDVKALSPDQIPGVQAFVLIDDLAAQGGATLALAGSQRLKNVTSLNQHLDALASGDAVHIDGQKVALIEMTGRAGDVYLMDMRLWHTPSMNASQRPRLMATSRFMVG